MKIFLDSGDPVQIHTFYPEVDGFTTNPTLMKAAGIKNYREFAKLALGAAGGKPISFEVFADTSDEIKDQAEIISSWGENIYVKIPVVTTSGVFNGPLIRDLWKYYNMKLNITAVMTKEQINWLVSYLSRKIPTIVSIFAGRIADTGVDAEIEVAHAKMMLRHLSNVEVLWASAREIFNMRQAVRSGADIITLSPELLRKRALIGKDLTQYSIETVQQFKRDSERIEF